MEEQTLLPLGIVALPLGVPRSWLRDEAEAGRVPCLKAGKRILFDVQLTEQLLLDRARKIKGIERD